MPGDKKKPYTNADAQAARSTRESRPMTDTTPGDTVNMESSPNMTGRKSKYVIEAHPDHPSGGQRIGYKRVPGT